MVLVQDYGFLHKRFVESYQLLRDQAAEEAVGPRLLSCLMTFSSRPLRPCPPQVFLQEVPSPVAPVPARSNCSCRLDSGVLSRLSYPLCTAACFRLSSLVQL